MITSKAPFWRKLLKRFRFKRAERRRIRIAIEHLEIAINMPRVDGRHDKIKEAFGELMSAMNPVDKEKIRRAM